MSVTREELGLAISRAIRETDESAMHSLDEYTLSLQCYIDVRDVADKLIPLLDHAFLDGLYTGLRQGYEEDSPYRKAKED